MAPGDTILSTTSGCVEAEMLWCKVLFHGPQPDGTVVLGLLSKIRSQFVRTLRTAEIARHTARLHETDNSSSVLC